MQYANHDFYSNFTASVKAGDTDMTSEIFANELSDMIVFDAAKTIDTLNNVAGAKLSTKDADEEIVDYVIADLSGNSKMKKAFAFMIAEGNELINSKNSKDKSEKGQRDIVNKIADGMNKVATGIVNSPEKFKEDTMKQIESKASAKKEYKRTIWKKDKKGANRKWIYAVAGVTVAFLVFVYYRQKRAISKATPQMIMGNGGVMADYSQPNFHNAQNAAAQTASTFSSGGMTQPMATPQPTAQPTANPLPTDASITGQIAQPVVAAQTAMPTAPIF